MLLIDGLGLGVNWQRFLSETLNPVVAPPPPPPPPPKKDDPAAGPANPAVTPPIPVDASLATDPSKPTNAEIKSATSLIQSMAAQYTAPPPDITVENDKTKAVQKAIQDAQTKYDNASQALQGAQNVLHLVNRDPESTADDRKTAQADYAKARTAADTAQRELNVTTDAGYMILYGEQAKADMPAGMKFDDSGKVTDPGDAQHAADQKFNALLAAFPDHPNDPKWVPQPRDCKNPLQIRLYNDWQTASAKAAVGASKYYADVTNSNLAYAQFQSYLADPDYKAALDAGVGRLNDALQPQGLQVTMPDAPDSPDAAQQAVTAAAKDANYANAAYGAANDSLTLANAQQQYDSVTGREGPTVIATSVSDAKTALARAQTAANTSGGYLQMLSAQRQVDTLQADYTKKQDASNAWHKNNPHAMIKDPQVDLDLGDAYAKLYQARQQADIAHDGFVAAYGASLAQQYDDQASQIKSQVSAQSLFTRPTLQSPLLTPSLSTANGLSGVPTSSLSTALPTSNGAPSLSASPLLDHPFLLPQSTGTPAAPTGPTMLDVKRIQVVAGAIRAADARLSNQVNERATNAALDQARVQQTQAKSTLESVQKDYDDWAAANPPPMRFRVVAGDDMIPAPSMPLPNPKQALLDKAKADVTEANNTVQRLQLLSETSHQQVLMDGFDAGLDERLRYAAPGSDAENDYKKALHDFYEAHRGELSNSLLDAASASTNNGDAIPFGTLTANEQRNLIGVALGIQPDVQNAVSSGDGSDPVSPMKDEVARFTDKEKLSTIDKVRDKLLSIGGGESTQVNVLPMVYASKQDGMTTSAIFKVTGKDGTQYVDETASTYHDINDYIDNNELSSDGTVDIATGHNADGTLQLVSKAAHHESGFDSFLNTLTSTGLNIGMMIGGMALEGLGTLLDGTGVGAIVGVPLNILGATMTYTAIGATMTSAGLDLANRAEHGRSLNPFTDAGARADFVNLVPMGAAGAAKLAGSKLFTRAVTALTRTPKVASVLATGAKATAVVTGVGGAVEAFGEAGVDYWNGNTKQAGEELKSGLTNVALMAVGGLKERAVTTVANRTGRPFVARTTNGKTVTVDGQMIGRLLNKDGDASLAAGRHRVTFDGERVTVSADGTLMVGDKVLTYEDKPIRVLDRASRKALPPGESVVLGEDGKLSVVSASDKNWTNGTRIDSLTDTGERLSFGPDGGMSTTPKVVARTRLDLLDSTLQQARDAYAAARDAEPATRELARTAAQDETASAATNARSARRTSEERARVDEQHEQSDADHATNAASNRRSADARAMRYRPLDIETPAGAGKRDMPAAARPRVDVKVVDLAEQAPGARPATFDPAGIAVPNGPRAEPMQIGDRTVTIVRDGAASHAPTLDGMRPQDFADPIIVVAGEHDALLAPELANRWERPVYAAAPDAFGPDGQLRTDARVLRFDPAPETEAATGAVAGAAAADEAPHANAPRPPADDTVIVLAGKRGPNEGAVPQPATTRQPVNALDGRFSAPNRVLVLVRPERADAPERAPARDRTAPVEHRASSAARADGAKSPRRTSANDAAAPPDTDLVAAHPDTTEPAAADRPAPSPGWFTRMQVRFGGAPLPEAAQALAMQSATLATQLRMLGDAGWRVKVGKRGGGSHVDPRKRVMTIDGALEDAGSITYTLASEARRAVEATAGVLNVDYGNRGRFTRKALEAEARAQINAFEARYEIALSSGVDIAEHASLPEPIAREGVDWQGPSHDYAGTVERLADSFADAPVSGHDGKTYREFYDDVWARQKRRGGIAHRMPAPHMLAEGDGAAPSGRAHLDERTAWSHAHAVLASPFGDGRPAPDAAELNARRDGHTAQLPEHGMVVLHADTLPDGTLLVDGKPVGMHEYVIANAPWRLVKDAEAIVLAAKHGGNEAAARLANVLRRSVYAPPERAVGNDAALLDTRAFHRFDPAPAAPHALGELAADANGVHLDGDPGARIDVEHHLGELLGAGARKTGFALGDDAALVTVDHSPPPFDPSQAPATIDAQRAADEQIVIDEHRTLQALEELGIRTVQLHGPFRSLSGVVSALVRPLGVFHSDEFATGALPPVVSRDGIRNIMKLHEVLEAHKIGFDLQGIFTSTGDFLVCDPGPIRHNEIAYSMSRQRLDTIQRGVLSWIELHAPELLQPPRDDAVPADAVPADTLPADAFVQKPSLITRVRMRVGGAPLPDEVGALALQSSTLATQLRMLDSNGWRVRVGKPGSGSRIDAKRKRVTIDGAVAGPEAMTYVLAHEALHAVEAIQGSLGLDYSSRGRFTRTALEAEARAQLNAFEARYEIRLASGIDIAAKVRLPDALQREADAWRPEANDAATVARLADAFADAPVSGAGGKTYTAFYGDAYDRGRTGGTRAMPAPEMRAAQHDESGAPRSMREIQAQRAAWSQANVEHDASPFGAGGPPPIDTLSFLRDGRVLIDPGSRLAIVPAETLPDGTLLGPDRQPVDPHAFTLFNPPPSDTGYTTILSARHANEGAAAQLANLWQRPVYTAHPDAVGAAGAPADLSGMNRYAPAAYRQPSLGELSVDRVHGDLYVDGDPARRADPADFLGPVLGSGAYKTVFDGGTGQAIGVFRDESISGLVDAYEAVQLEQGGLAMLRDVYKLPTSTTDGPFTVANRVAVVLKPSAQISSVDVEFDVGLPSVVSRGGLADLAKIRRVTQEHHLLYDFQVPFGRNGDVMLHDPGEVLPGADPEGSVLGRIDEVAAKIHSGIATGRIRLAHPAMTEHGAYAPRRGTIERVVTLFRGAVLRMRAHVLASRSPTLVAQMRLAKSDGWKVKLGARGEGQYVDAERRVIVLDGNTRHAGTLVFALAHEVQHSVDIATDALGLDHSSPEAYVRSLLLAEARAQVNADRVRDEILAAGGGDIAAHVHLPGALARAARHAYESGDAAALHALAERFGDTRTSLPGNPTYRVLYAEQARALTGDARLPKLAAPGSGNRPAAAPGSNARASTRMERARAWLDERGLRTLKRIEGAHSPALRDLTRETGRNAHVLIARADPPPSAGSPPKFIAEAEVDANGAITITRRDRSLSYGERRALGNALSRAADANTPDAAAAARRGFDFYRSPVTAAELRDMGGPSRIEPAHDGDTIELSPTGNVDGALASAIDALGSVKHYSNANKAIAGARNADTIYAVDRKTGDILGHAKRDPNSGVWYYEEKSPIDGAKVKERPLDDAFQRRVNARVRRGGTRHRIPLSRARQRGVAFIATEIGPDMMARIGRFDPIRAPKKDTTYRLPSRLRPRYMSHALIARSADATHRVALLTRARTAALLRRQNASGALPAGTSAANAPAGATTATSATATTTAATQPARRAAAGRPALHDALVAAHLLPASAAHALDFSGHNAVHLLALAERGALSPDTHRVYVYRTTDPIAHRLASPDGVLVPDAQGNLFWHDDWRDTGGASVPLDASPIGRGPYGANVHLLLTELQADGIDTYAPGTRLDALNSRVERLEKLQNASHRTWADKLRDWASREKASAIHERDTMQAQLERERQAARNNQAPLPEHPVLEIKPYQPALVSSTQIEWKQRYGDGGRPDPLTHVTRLKKFIEREDDTRAGPLELQDRPADAPPPAVMADAQAWRWFGKWLRVARDYTAGGARFAPVPKWKNLHRRLSAAVAVDKQIIKSFFASSRDVQYRVVPMSRAYRLSDDPRQFLEQIRRNGAANAAVTIVLDPHTLAAAQGKKHEQEFVNDVKQLGDQTRAKMDYATATITGENGHVVHLDELTEAHLHAWLDAAAEGGFLLRLETASGRALVSPVDERYQAGTNDQYHDYVRLASLLEKWAVKHPDQAAPHVMVTFHGWDAVPESVPGAGHVELVNQLLDRPTLKWVHVGLSYATHGSDFIANQELTTALAKMLVDRVRGRGYDASTFERIHGADALTRVFERIDPDTLVEQHQMLLAEIDRIGRENGMKPAQIDALVDRLYEGNTTKLLNRARYAVADYATRAWRNDPDRAPARESAARSFTEDWQRDIGSKLKDPQQTKLPRAQRLQAKLPAWTDIVQKPELVVDDAKPLSDSRLVSAQSSRTGSSGPQVPITPEQAAHAELNALRLQQADRLRTWFTRQNLLSMAIGLGVGFGTHHFGLTSPAFKQTSNALFVGARTGRLVQALHQDSVRALQGGDPRLFRRVLDRFVRGLESQLDAHEMDKDLRGASLQLLANEARVKVDGLLALHESRKISAEDAVAYTKMIANDMIAQMQGVLGGTSIQQMHHGNPRRLFGKVGRSAALAGYVGLGEIAVHNFMASHAVAPLLGGIGAVVGLGYTAAIHLGATRNLSLDRRSRVVRAIDATSDIVSIAAGYASAASATSLPIALSGAASATLLALARVDTHMPNLTKAVTSRIPTAIVLVPFGIYVGNWLYTYFNGSSPPPQKSNVAPPTNGASPSPSPSPSASASPSPSAATPAPSATAPSPGTSASPSTGASPPASTQPPSGTPSPTPYLVVQGDSLWVIAHQHRDSLLDAAHVSAAERRKMSDREQDNVAFREILQLNPSAAANASHLSIGTPINVG
ncbi:LWXIA domain-containing protein [Burkholderia multivorans]|uniref:LWXIA domain-containing protein n=1 Tax=Burkholderia multivorans TaxID=87883 RepID=UPI001590B8A5|nr:LWXIA domain-containing protein [Burkholderia multivorans]